MTSKFSFSHHYLSCMTSEYSQAFLSWLVHSIPFLVSVARLLRALLALSLVSSPLQPFLPSLCLRLGLHTVRAPSPSSVAAAHLLLPFLESHPCRCLTPILHMPCTSSSLACVCAAVTLAQHTDHPLFSFLHAHGQCQLLSDRHLLELSILLTFSSGLQGRIRVSQS